MVTVSPNFIAIFYESNTEGTNFRIMFYVYVMCMFCISPEVTLCGWRGNKPSINKLPYAFVTDLSSFTEGRIVRIHILYYYYYQQII